MGQWWEQLKMIFHENDLKTVSMHESVGCDTNCVDWEFLGYNTRQNGPAQCPATGDS